MRVRIGTMNMENLFLRWRLIDNERGQRQRKPVDKDLFVRDGGTILMLGWDRKGFYKTSPQQRKATAMVLCGGSVKDRPEHLVVGVQEVESIQALKLFNAEYLDAKRFAEVGLVDGNDAREIDVGVISDLPITMRSHQFDRNSKGTFVFARDCLEVDVQVSPKRTMTLYINHLTSKLGGDKAQIRRKEQVRRIKEIITERFGTKLEGDFAVLGDFNALPNEPEMRPLLKLGLENVIERLPPVDRWTYVYKGQTQQLDYLLLSPSLAARAGNRKPIVERRGLPDSKFKMPGKFPGVAKDGTEASDHCALFIDVDY